MDDKLKSQLKAVLKSEFLPLFIGLRDELKSINDLQTKILAKEFPEVQKTEITNHQEQRSEMGINNFPEVQRVEVTNEPKPIKSIKVDNLASEFKKQETAHAKRAKAILNKLVEKIDAIGDDGFDVRVVNQKEFPKEIKISNLKEVPVAEMPSSIRIANSLPKDAIPVVLTSKDKKRFVEAMQMVALGNDVNLERVIKAIEAVSVNIGGDLNVNTDYVEELLEIANETLQDILTTLQSAEDVVNFWGQYSVLPLDGNVLCSFVVPAGKVFVLQGVTCEGEDDGIFHFETTTTIWQARCSWANRTISAQVGAKVLEGATIELWAENRRNQTVTFSGGFYGVLKDI